MKKVILTLFSTFLIFSLYAQTPDGFNYQAVVRDVDGDLKKNEQVSLTISLLRGDPDGEVIYLETHNPTTNQYGLVNLIIGKGSTSDDLSTIDWSNGPYFLKIEVDGVSLGTTQLMTVPYAKYAEYAKSAKNVENAGSTDNQLDTTAQKGELIYYDGTNWTALDKPTNNKYRYTLKWDPSKEQPFWDKIQPESPNVETGSVTDITDNSAKCSGEVISDGGAEVTVRGIVWNTETSTSLTLDESNVTEAGSGIGKFTATLTNLNSSTEYFSRAFAVNVADTAYGNTIQWGTTASKTTE